MKMKVMYQTKNGDVFGKPDYSKLEKAKWYQKLFAKISKAYKRKFMILMPFDCEVDAKEWNKMLDSYK